MINRSPLPLIRYEITDQVTHPVVFCTALERARHVTEYQVRQTPRGATVIVCASGRLDLDGVRREIAHNLSGAGLWSPEVTVACVQSIERQQAGKLRRFVALQSQPCQAS